MVQLGATLPFSIRRANLLLSGMRLVKSCQRILSNGRALSSRVGR
jgi:hypothetical protein